MEFGFFFSPQNQFLDKFLISLFCSILVCFFLKSVFIFAIIAFLRWNFQFVDKFLIFPFFVRYLCLFLKILKRQKDFNLFTILHLEFGIFQFSC